MNEITQEVKVPQEARSKGRALGQANISRSEMKRNWQEKTKKGQTGKSEATQRMFQGREKEQLCLTGQVTTGLKMDPWDKKKKCLIE